MKASFASLLAREPARHFGAAAVTGAIYRGAPRINLAQGVQNPGAHQGDRCDKRPDAGQNGGSGASVEQRVTQSDQARSAEHAKQDESHPSLPAVQQLPNASTPVAVTAHPAGLAAWLRRSPDDGADELTASQAVAITGLADIDTDMGYLDGCWCGCAVEPEPLRRLPAEACTELGADTAPPRLGLLRRLHIALLERRLDIVRDEHDRYTHAGYIGPVYHRNSLQMQLQLMARIRELRGL